MSFVKLESIASRYHADGWQYEANGSVILNSSHIVDINEMVDANPLHDSAKEKFSRHFDVPAEELGIYLIHVIDNKNIYIVLPKKKFEEFK